jgi:predicted MarR family transcription regulator
MELLNGQRQDPSSSHLQSVSSAELVAPGGQESSEFEFGMIVGWNAFARWAVSCATAAGAPDLTMMDIVLLNHIRHRGRQKKIADICFTLTSYALRKLVSAGLASTRKVGKEVLYGTTSKGNELLQRYKEIRDSCLLPSLDNSFREKLGATAVVLRQMSSIYDQAARAATSL